ncbi:MAG: hypothetical protein WBN56_11110, partial [Robiginitalea sp.]
MSSNKPHFIFALLAFVLFAFPQAYAQKGFSKSAIRKHKEAVNTAVDQRHKQTQVMVDKVFSFAELGFHEV